MTPGKKAARTKLEKYGAEGLSDIAKKAAATRREMRNIIVADLSQHIEKSARSARYRAIANGKDFAAELELLALRLLEEQNYRCAVSGIPFDLEVGKDGSGAAPRPFIPSIDRIDAKGGYTEDNIRIICWACNCFLGTWGIEPALEIARGMSARAH